MRHLLRAAGERWLRGPLLALRLCIKVNGLFSREMIANRRIRILVVGKSGRLAALVESFRRSYRNPEVFVLGDLRQPSLTEDSNHFMLGRSDDLNVLRDAAVWARPDFVVIGPEEPLAAAAADLFEGMRIPCAGPTMELAKLESSKGYTRRLIAANGIQGNPEFRIFDGMGGIAEYLVELGSYVIKPDGLTGGKGVRVLGDHFHTNSEAVAYCAEIFAEGGRVVIEEKLEGEEFSFQSFFDGRTMLHTIPIQDHKRAFDGDLGPNTGGMGSYSCEDHSLPFLSLADIATAGEINRLVGEALVRAEGRPYKGIVYGGYMVTRRGLRVIEFNARFGDPEVMNLLPIMNVDAVDLFEHLVNQTLDQVSLSFQRKATVCKYIVPNEYPEKLEEESRVDLVDLVRLAKNNPNIRYYLGGLREEAPNEFYLSGSRAIACVGIGDTLAEAEALAEIAASSVEGPVRHRKDVGTQELVGRRVDHMDRVRGRSKAPVTNREGAAVH